MRRPLPRPWTARRLALDGVLLLVAAVVYRHHPAPAVHFAFLGFLIGIITGIWDAVSAAATVTVDILASSVTWIFGRLRDIVKVFGTGVSFLGGAVKDLGGLFSALWNDILKPFLSTIYKWLQDLGTFLKKLLAPVVKFIKAVRDDVLKIYDRFVLPVIHGLDIARQALELLSALGVKWAQAIEQRIAQLEAKISAPFMWIVDKLNEALGIINKIVTLDGLLQRLTLFKSLLSYKRDFVNFSVNAFVNPLDPGTAAAADAPYGSYTPQEHAGQIIGAWNDQWTPPLEIYQELGDDLVNLYRDNGLVTG